MAVEARHLNSLHPQLVCNNRQLLNGIDENLKMYGTSLGHGGLILPSEITTETLLPIYGSAITDSFTTKYPQPQTHSGIPPTLPLNRKRSRNSFYHLHCNQNNLNNNSSTSFLGEDISLMIRYQQLEIDNFIAQHVVKIRSGIEEHREANKRRILAAVEDVIVNNLRAKEDEVDKMMKLNRVLHEKVKSLSIENQMWRNLAESNEATVTTLRTNIEQVMRHRARGAENSQSCCSSNIGGEEEDNNVGKGGNWCRKCGKEESCVLLLPCRHLCVCTMCGLGLNICPVCKLTTNASLVVNKC
ncbi:putative BOI-related E3 ubiquitin-protein ligase 3 [Apium graveolens]|uniref:putative BOI-related E3 ubiquitin-protein ligase 3 n=1 Tax=Apium graveolens TaxID=4045 RepID=UPI003D7A8A4B